jgi:hypothetical protein
VLGRTSQGFHNLAVTQLELVPNDNVTWRLSSSKGSQNNYPALATGNHYCHNYSTIPLKFLLILFVP